MLSGAITAALLSLCAWVWIQQLQSLLQITRPAPGTHRLQLYSRLALVVILPALLTLALTGT